MKESRILHEKAMDYLSDAIQLKRIGREDEARNAYSLAFENERSAALLEIEAPEPTRSVLLRSAATIAFNIGKIREAEQLIGMGLSGNPPFEIAEELRDLLERVNFNRHLMLRGVELNENEMQLSLAGADTGFGIIRAEEFLSRFETLKKLTYRTIERRRDFPFRKHGQVAKEIKNDFEPFLSVPRAASFAVTIKFGRVIQKDFFEENTSSLIILDIMKSIDLVQAGESEKLKALVKRDEYYSNIIGLVKELAPDATNINFVGLTANINKEIRTTALTRLRSDIKMPIILPPDEGAEADEPIEITGKLTGAELYAKDIQVTDVDGCSYKIIVPDGIMADIVRPYWEKIVCIKAIKRGKSLYYSDLSEKKD